MVTRLFFCVAFCLLWAGEYMWALFPGSPKTSAQAFLLGVTTPVSVTLLQGMWMLESPKAQDTRSQGQETEWF